MKYKKTVLPNGMRILTIPLTESQSAIGMVLVETGSDFESKELNGLSHFLEHMCFKGTTNRTGEQIKLEIDGMGAASNAFTANEFTGYYAKASKDKIHKIIDFVSDVYLNPTFPEKDIEIERGVIVEEINMYEDLPQQVVAYMWQELLYPNTPAGRKIIGPKENILKFKKDDFIAYHQLHYTPAKTVFVVAGNIDEKKVTTQLKNIFAPISNVKNTKRPKTKFKQSEAQLKIKYKKIDQSHLIMGFRAFDQYNDKNYALKLASIILGKGLSSRLFTRMRDELGLCYYVSASVDTYTDRGAFLVRSGVTNARVHEAIEVLMTEFKKIRDEEIQEKELKKAKDFLIGNFAIGLETSEDVADYFGFQELLREEILYPKEYIKKIKAVTVKDIQKVLKEIMKEKNLNFTLIGPFEEGERESFKKLLKI
jgi:predicted Zn-dependent peptidase